MPEGCRGGLPGANQPGWLREGLRVHGTERAARAAGRPDGLKRTEEGRLVRPAEPAQAHRHDYERVL